MPNASGVEPQPLDRHVRAGKARIGRARKPGDLPPTTKPESPRGKGWLISMKARSPAWRPVSSCSSRRRRRCGANVVGPRRRARATRCCRGPRRRRRPARFTKDGEPVAPVRAQQRRAARSRRATARRLGGRWAVVRRLRDPDDPRRDAQVRRRRHSGTYWSFWLNYKSRAPAGAGRRCRTATTSCSSRAASGARRSRRRCGSPGSRPRRRRARRSACASSSHRRRRSTRSSTRRRRSRRPRARR